MMIGQTIKQYRITAKLGEGGMGEVYLADDTRLDRQVALKFLPRHFSSDPESRSRFTREAKALATLNHPNIVHVYDVSDHEGQPFIAMEYVEGQSLKVLVESSEVEIEKATDIVAQAADGLAAAHKREIVHRDIKSENIVISSEGRVKIMDFGLATWKGVTKVTVEGSTLGTRAYMSPEQSIGGDVDHRTDLWSLGVVFYELVTRHLPFVGGHDSVIAFSIANDEPEPIARYKSGSPDELQRIVSKCLAKNPDERYQSAADLATDLRGLKSKSSGAATHLVSAPSSQRRALVSAGAAVLIAAMAVVAALLWNPFKAANEVAEARRKMLAVLPFENLGPDDQEYFADGVTEEITSRLASIASLGVISRTSSMRYKHTDKSVREIGSELGVDYILEGTIRWDQAGDTDYVRITPQLISVRDDTHLWADRIERPLNRVFAVQTDIAEQVAKALSLTLGEPEKRSIARTPTGDLRAYDYFLRGLNIWRSTYKEDQVLTAIQLFTTAVSLDSQFVPAWVELAQTHAFVAFRGWQDGPLHLDLARRAAERAVWLAPEIPESHVAMGFYFYWGHRDYGAALNEFAIAEPGLPNSSDLLLAIGYVKRRQGQVTESYNRIKRAYELDPSSPRSTMELAVSCNFMRRYDEAEEILRRGISLYPENVFMHGMRMWATLGRSDDPGTVQRVLDQMPATVSSPLEQHLRSFGAAVNHDYDLALQHSRASLALATSAVDSSQSYGQMGFWYEKMGRQDFATACFDSALYKVSSLTEDPGVRYSALKGDYLEHLPGVYAGLGRKEEAISAARQYSDQMPIALDAFEGAMRLKTLAAVYAAVGEPDRAIDLLEQLTSIPSEVSVNRLRLSPLWDSLRDNPRFQALLEREDIVF